MQLNDFISMQIDGQEITELRINNVLVWEKNTLSLILSFTGSDFNVDSSSEGVTGRNIVIDWGDGATTNYTSANDLNHTYSASGDYSITITGITGLENNCFYNCTGLTNVVIPEGITSLRDFCFFGCSSLTSVTIPDSVTNLGQHCFSGCSSLTSVAIPNSVTNLGQNCFMNCSSLTSIIIPQRVTSLKDACFGGCSGLTSIEIPDSVTSFGNYCFSNCSGLTSIIIPKRATSLGNSCFANCSSLTNIIIPNSVTNLGPNCFMKCSGLTGVVISDNITSLGNDCFYGCSGLTSVAIPKGVTSLGRACFVACSNLTSLVCNWESNPPSYNSGWISFTSSSFKFSIPYGTTSIYTAAGYPSDKLEERENPTLTLSTENEIISKYGDGSSGEEIGANINDFAFFSITLTGVDNAYKDIIIKANGTQIDTVQTNSGGVAKYNYTSKGDGKIEFTAEYGDIISNSCNIIDAKYYASNETISSAPSYNNDRTLFASDYTLSEGDKVHFRFKSMPNRCIYGFGSTAGSDFVFEKDGTTLKVWRNVLNNTSYNNPSNYMPSTEYDIVMEFTKYSSSTYRMKLYKDDTYIDYWNCGNSIRKVRVDKFFNDDFEIEVFVL